MSNLPRLPQAEVEALSNKIFVESKTGVPTVLIVCWWAKPASDGIGNNHQMASNSSSPEELARLLEELAQEVRQTYQPPAQGKPS